MNGNIITIIVVTASAVLTFLLTQPPGTFPPSVLLVIGAVNIALAAVSRFLPSSATPVQVEVTKPVPVTSADVPPAP